MSLGSKRLFVANTVGRKGEDIACRFLMKRGYKIMERNYLKKFGEIDIVVEKGKKISFIEVKAVSSETLANVSDETLRHRPEENIHQKKIMSLRRVIETYCIEREMGEAEWNFGIITVRISDKERKARVTFMPDIIL